MVTIRTDCPPRPDQGLRQDLVPRRLPRGDVRAVGQPQGKRSRHRPLRPRIPGTHHLRLARRPRGDHRVQRGPSGNFLPGSSRKGTPMVDRLRDIEALRLKIAAMLPFDDEDYETLNRYRQRIPRIVGEAEKERPGKRPLLQPAREASRTCAEVDDGREHRRRGHQGLRRLRVLDPGRDLRRACQGGWRPAEADRRRRIHRHRRDAG